MANYKDKKKLIDDNSDIYISDYDKELGYSYLSDIIDQKRAYTAAEKAGDTAGMRNANERANSIRLQAGSYTAGSDGSKYNRVKRPYEEEDYTPASNYYTNERNKVYRRIDSYPEFTYNPESDPLYQVYKDIYLSLGNDAYNRALADNSLRTEGISNTSAVSAASLAKNKYNSMLTSKIPELYEKAYSRHKDGEDSLYRQLEAIWKSEEDDYGKYRDNVEDYRENRDYYYKKDRDIADDNSENYKEENDIEYKTSRDEVEDSNADREYELDVKKHDDEVALTREENEANNIIKTDKQNNDEKTDKYELAVKISKVLYGDSPISIDTFNEILRILE